MVIRDVRQWISGAADTSNTASGAGTEPAASQRDADFRRNLSYTAVALGAWGLATALVIFLQNTGASGEQRTMWQAVQASAHGFGAALCFASLGALIGFLFGVPRTAQLEPGSGASGGGANQSVEDTSRLTPTRQSVNTNVEKVSDWLTTIIVGIGLTQLNTLPEQLQRLGNYFEKSGYTPGSFYVVVSLNAAVLGFFGGYLLTRLFLARAFHTADDLSRERTQTIREARQLERVSEHSAAVRKLEAALETVKPETPVRQKREVLEGLVFNSLYEEKPRSFENALKYGAQYLAEIGPNENPFLYVYLACAHGQRYEWHKAKQSPQATLDDARAKALDAVRTAVSLDPSTKPLLRRLMHPVQGSSDDDLKEFAGDPEFETAVA